MNDHDLDYLRECLRDVHFTPFEWDGEDRNIATFRSKDEFIAWYCQPPGVDGQPYRDRGFYCRELAMLSRVLQPEAIVEFGTSLGIGTCLLHWLNPSARLVTVDANTQTYMPGDLRVPIGHLAKHQNIPCEYINTNSWDYRQLAVDLCFIDGDHSYEAVVRDSERAWANRAVHFRWSIVWHDYNGRHPGVMRAVSEFCANNAVKLQSRPDSDTVWVERGY